MYGQFHGWVIKAVGNNVDWMYKDKEQFLSAIFQVHGETAFVMDWVVFVE